MNMPRLKFHVIKDNKGKKNKTKVIGHIFQDVCWEKHYSGYHLWFVMAIEIIKGKETIIDI